MAGVCGVGITLTCSICFCFYVRIRSPEMSGYGLSCWLAPRTPAVKLPPAGEFDLSFDLVQKR